MAGDSISIRRVYDPPGPNEGYRVLVDRLWPRGVKKEDLHHDEWLEQVAPSAALRRWFGHDPERFDEFERRYRRELEDNADLDRLVAIAEDRPLTLLCAARDTEHNQARVLERLIRERLALRG